MNDDLLPIPLEMKEESIIKVMGVGGGGCNAVNHMYQQGITGVTFLACNTDRMALEGCSVPAKLQLGPGLGAGGNPEKARQYAEENRERIRESLNDGTQMLFLAAGMGGGTGTGATAIIAEEAQQMGILTVGIVTIPFAFEGKPKIRKAITGVATLAEHVDAMLVYNNEKLKLVYPDITVLDAFSRSNDLIGNTAKSIAEIITVPGYINTDFADVYTTLKDGKVAIMNVGQASGEQRILTAIRNALQSPLVNTNDVHGAKRVLLQLYCSTEYAIQTQETDQIYEFVREVGEEVELQWGVSLDESLGEEVRVTLIATGYEVSDIPSLKEDSSQPTVEEAIKNNYDDLPTPKETKPNTIELKIAEVPSVSDDDIVISLDEDQPAQPVHPEQTAQSEPAEQPTHRGFASWMRTRK